MASGVDDGAQCAADEAIGTLVGHLALRRSLLAWTMRWCPDGEASWAAIWSAASDAKAMINVLVAVGVIDEVAVRAAPTELSAGVAAGDAIVRFSATRTNGSRVAEAAVRVDGLAALLRSEFARPSLDAVVGSAQRR